MRAANPTLSTGHTIASTFCGEKHSANVSAIVCRSEATNILKEKGIEAGAAEIVALERPDQALGEALLFFEAVYFFFAHTLICPNNQATIRPSASD